MGGIGEHLPNAIREGEWAKRAEVKKGRHLARIRAAQIPRPHALTPKRLYATSVYSSTLEHRKNDLRVSSRIGIHRRPQFIH